MQLGLAAGQHVAHALDAHRGLRLQPGELRHLALARLGVAPARRAPGEHRDRRQDRERGQHDRDRPGQHEEIVGHPRTLTRFGVYEQKVNKKSMPSRWQMAYMCEPRAVGERRAWTAKRPQNGLD